jgi:hypothetical protein
VLPKPIAIIFFKALDAGMSSFLGVALLKSRLFEATCSSVTVPSSVVSATRVLMVEL